MQGAKIVPLLLSVSLGLALRFLVPAPLGVTTQAWTLLSIFVSTIAGGLGGAGPGGVGWGGAGWGWVGPDRAGWVG